MRAIIQRVTRSRVEVEGAVTGEIEKGYMVLLGVSESDTDADAKYIADKIVGLRIFEDDADKLNLSLADVNGSVLLVSQFTLYGDVRKGRRPSFTRAAGKELATALLHAVKNLITDAGIPVEEGVFGADMAVHLINDGPVTILLDSERTF